MKEQHFEIKDTTSFEPKQIFDCGQCFRWNEQSDGSYTGVVENSVLNVKNEHDRIVITGISEKPLEEICYTYFDLGRDYEKIKNELSMVDSNMKTSILYGKGIRILNQDIWETLISFIISANNNIPRIKRIIETLSKTYGNKLEWNGKYYYTFPSAKQLKRCYNRRF